MRKWMILGMIILSSLAAFVAILIGIVFKFNELSFHIALYIAMGSGFANLLLVLISVVNKETIKRLTGAIHVTYVVIAVVFHYVLSYLGHYEELSLLYWLLFFGIVGCTVVVMTVLNYKLAPQKLTYSRRNKE